MRRGLLPLPCPASYNDISLNWTPSQICTTEKRSFLYSPKRGMPSGQTVGEPLPKKLRTTDSPEGLLPPGWQIPNYVDHTVSTQSNWDQFHTFITQASIPHRDEASSPPPRIWPATMMIYPSNTLKALQNTSRANNAAEWLTSTWNAYRSLITSTRL